MTTRRCGTGHLAGLLGRLSAGVIALVFIIPAVAKQVEVRPSTTHLYADQTLSIDVVIDGAIGRVSVEPAHSDDFALVGAEANPVGDDERTAVVEGVAQRVHDYVYRFTASPLHAGTLSLPSFEIVSDGNVQHTQPLTIVVSPETTASLLICEVESAFKTAYVGQPLELTLRVWVRVDQQPDFVNNLGRFLWDTQFRDESATRLGIFAGVDLLNVRFNPSVARSRDSSLRYHVFEVRKTIYPSEIGRLNWGDIEFAYNYPTSLRRDPFGGLRVGASPLPLRRRPALPRVDVEPLPTQGQPIDFRGAIGEYEISTVASPLEVTLGDPIALTIEITGRGLERLRPPDLTLNETLMRDFELVAEEPAGEIFGSHKLFVRTIRPRRLDVEQIPALAFASFDPRTGQYETTYSEPISILVRPRLIASDVATSDAVATQPSSEGLSLPPFEMDVTRLLAGEPRVISWGMWLGLVPMPLLCVAVLWRRHWLATAPARRDVRRQRETLNAAMNACRGTAATPQAVRVALLAYLAAYTRCVQIRDRRSAEQALDESGVSAAVIEAVSKAFRQLDECDYGGSPEAATVSASIASTVSEAIRLVEAERRG